MIIRQQIDADQQGNRARVNRVLRVEDRLYVDVWQTVDATEMTLMKAVNQAVDRFVILTKSRRGYGTDERNGHETI